MNIAGLSAANIAAANTSAQDQISIAVLAKSLDTVEDMGDGMQKMMEMSVAPHIGGNIDVSL